MLDFSHVRLAPLSLPCCAFLRFPGVPRDSSGLLGSPSTSFGFTRSLIVSWAPRHSASSSTELPTRRSRDPSIGRHWHNSRCQFALVSNAVAASLGIFFAAGLPRHRRRLRCRQSRQTSVADIAVTAHRPPTSAGSNERAGRLYSLGEEVRADFPALSQQRHQGTPLVYLDTAATAQKPNAVLDAIQHYYCNAANVHRGNYALAAEATQAYEAARVSVARFIGARVAEEVVFTSGATEAINLVAQSWGDANVGLGDEIVITQMEHHSNIVPWQLLAERRGAVVKYVRFNPTGELDLEHLELLLTPRTRLVAVTHVSNTLGCINPVSDIVAAAQQVGARVLLDACQSAPHLPIDVTDLGVDFLAASGHKMYGPTGIGFLWGRLEILTNMPPWKGGGEMIKEVTLRGSTFADVPARFEAGTPAIAQAVGLGAACEYLSCIGMPRIQSYEKQLARYLWDKLSAIDGLLMYGPPPERGRAALVAFNDSTEGVYPQDIAVLADGDGFAIRAGQHCAQPAMLELGATFGSARVSLGFYNTFDDIDLFVESLRNNLEALRSGEVCTFDPENPDACFCSSDRARS